MKKMMTKKRKTMMSGMSYDTRLRRFNQEKEEFLRKNFGLPPAEFQRLLDQLIDKWKI